jgi:hypothetical protein
MSEYQYYEFQAIDRPLTEKEMRELRSYSTRARITPTSFVNDYSWGNFKGDEDAWMERYFDAFLYVANWGTHVLKLRLPSELLGLAEVREYCTCDYLSARERNGKVILTFTSEDEEGNEWGEEEGLLSSLISIRAELARGDRRALYLGWLRCVQSGELSDEEEEPSVPPGLGELSASLERMVEFLRLDADLLGVAAQASAPRGVSKPGKKDVQAWLATVPIQEKDTLLARLLTDDAGGAVELLRRFERDRQRTERRGTGARPRTVGQLCQAAQAQAQERKRKEAQKAAAARECSEREAAAARARHLASLVGKEHSLWVEVERLVAAKKPKAYDAAVKLLVDLRALAARTGDADFNLRLESLRALHSRKTMLLKRMSKAGL